MLDTFKLPSSSYEELVKIIKAYSSIGKAGQAQTLDALAQASGMQKTTISANNGFLMELDLISEGKAKAPTEICVKLGRAYSLNMCEEIVETWRVIVENCDFLNRMISAIKIRNGMDRSNLINHIIYSSGVSGNNKSKAGAGAVIEILKCAGIAEESDGKIIAKPLDNTTSSTSTCGERVSKKNDSLSNTPQIERVGVPVSNTCQIILNLNLNASVEDLDNLAEKVKKFIEEIKQ